jgi:flagellar basal-body rod modification protein FlgD
MAGGGAAAKFQSALQSAGKSGQTQLGLSPKAAAATASGARSAASGANGTSGSGGTGGSSDTDDTGASITANDFLTLLVTEMQNQDPTANVDPNAYIDQLVQINSLEQLISINQNLSDVLSAASPSAQTSSSGGSAIAASSGVSGVDGASAITDKASGKGLAASSAPSIRNSATRQPNLEHGPSPGSVSRTGSSGNLSPPKPSAASERVGHALDGHPRPGGSGHAIRHLPPRSIAR